MKTDLKTACPSCGKRLRINETKRGKTVRCPACRETFGASDVTEASQMTLDTTDAAVSVDTTQLVKDQTLSDLVSPAAQNSEEKTLRKLGRFELKSVLGAGGFGKVYRAYDPQLERFVALKVPTFGPNQKTRIARFLAEAKAAARLKHANIVSTFETGKADKQHYIASEFIDGHLLSALAKRERFSVKDSVMIVRKLAEAAAYAHSQGIVHRDIKPHNVMIDSSGEPQLMDFGLAKRTDDNANLTTDGALLGTPAYMSPEQARGELHLVNESSDQYSLGVVLYFLLTGATPCEGSPHLVVAEVSKGAFHSVREQNRRVDRTLDAICQKAMHPEQGERYTDCSQFAADLGAWTIGKPVQARSQSSLQKLGRVLSENGLLLAMFTSIFALSIFVAVFGFKLMRGPEPAAIVPIVDNAEVKQDRQIEGDSLRVDSEPPTISTADVMERSQANHENAAEVPIPVTSTNALLLDMTDPVRCAIVGSWNRSTDALECGSAGGCRIQIPYSVTGEYDLDVTVEPVSGVHGLAIGLSYDSKPFHVLLSFRDANQVENVGTHSSGVENPSRTETPVPFKVGERSLVRCSVRDGSVKVTADGFTLIDWKGDAALLNQNGYWTTPYRTALYLGAFSTSFRFHNVTIHHLNGTGRELKPPLILSDSDAAEWTPEFGQGIQEAFRIVERLEGTLSVEQNDGDEYRLKVTAHRKQVSDSDLAAIAQLTGPIHLSLDYSHGFTVTGFRALSQMRQLEIAGFRASASLTDEMALLIPPENLVHLGIDRTKVTDAVAPHIAKMHNLKDLRLQLSELQTNTARAVTTLPKLESVWFGGKGVSDDIIKSFSASSLLRDLRIYNGLPSDNQQSSPAMTEDCLESLLRLKNLENVSLERTGVTTQQVASFQKKYGHFRIQTSDSVSAVPAATGSQQLVARNEQDETAENWLDKVKTRMNNGDLFGAFVLARGLPDSVRTSQLWKRSPEIHRIEELGQNLTQASKSEIFANTNASESADPDAINKRVKGLRSSSTQRNVAAVRIFVENAAADSELLVKISGDLRLLSRTGYGYSKSGRFQNGDTAYVYSDRETSGIVRVSALRHNPVEFSATLSSKGEGYQGALILTETPVNELGALSIQLVPESGTQLSDYNFANTSISVNGATSSSPEFLVRTNGIAGPLRLIPAASYSLKLQSPGLYGSPLHRLNEAIVAGQQTDVSLPIFRKRMVTFEWMYRDVDSGPWMSGKFTGYTGSSMRMMRNDWPNAESFMVGLGDWSTTGTSIRTYNANCEKILTDDWPPTAEKSPERPRSSSQEQIIAAGDVFAVWNYYGRTQFQAMMRVKSIALP